MPALEAIHELMKRENDAGTITRQEAVSMIPPLLMDIQSHHKVCIARFCFELQEQLLVLQGWISPACYAACRQNLGAVRVMLRLQQSTSVSLFTWA